MSVREVIGLLAFVAVATLLFGLGINAEGRARAMKEVERSRRYTVTINGVDRYSHLQKDAEGWGWAKYYGPRGEVILVEGPHTAVLESESEKGNE